MKENGTDGRNLSLALRYALVVFALWSAGPDLLRAQNEDLRVLDRWIQHSDAQGLLQHHLNSLAFQLIDKRLERIRTIRTAEEWRVRQQEVKAGLHEVLGPFPEKTPLNARVTRTLSKAGFRIEHIVFESRPDFYVTGSLFIPDGLPAKAPAILNVIGHTDIAYRAASYQQLLLNLVRKGFIVFAIDPIGQGERLQYYDPEQKRSLVGPPTREHSYFGRQCFLAGSSAAHYFTWDGIRAIDYLVSRPEVDPERIGVTGISGGGTQTSYIAAVDERVTAAAPTCYICGFRRLFETIGPQDAEQNFNAGLVHALDHADFLEVRAPRPTLVVATTRDFFSIQGARETVQEAEQAFRVLGAEAHLSLAEDDHGHGYTPKNREAIYAFFQRHLDNPGDASDEVVELLSQEELRVTTTGQVLDSLGGETVFSLNRALTQRLVQQLQQSRAQLSSHLQRVKQDTQEISGYVRPGPLAGVVFRGRYQRPGYVIEKYVMAGEGDCILPFLFFRPDASSQPKALIYLHPDGKSAEIAPGGELETLVQEGYAVLSLDVSGTGELGQVDNDTAFLGVQTGRSIAGIRAGDIIRGVQYLRSRQDIAAEEIVAVARGAMAIPLLHAAAFEPELGKIALIEPLVSFRTVAENRFYSAAPGALVANALTKYDLPDLGAALAPRQLLIINPQDHLGTRAGQALVEEEYRVLREAYTLKNAAANLRVRRLEPFESTQKELAAWLREAGAR